VRQVIAHRDAVINRDAARLVDEQAQLTAAGTLKLDQLVSESGKHGFQAGGQIHYQQSTVVPLR